MSECQRTGCGGEYDADGYCTECGHLAPPPSPGTPSGGPPSSDLGSSGPSTGSGASGPTTSSGSSRASGRTRASERGRLGAGLFEMPRVPVPDPSSAVLTDPQVPESRRFCANPDCGRPVGRGRDGRPGLAEGFCAQCGTRYSFVPRLSRGDVAGGRYEVIGCLAFGGLGWIYLARDKNVGDEVSDRWVVLKGLIDAGDADAMAAAVAERRFLVEVDHPAIVKIHDFVSHPDPRTGARIDYIVMEYVGGRSLKDVRLDRPRVDGERAPLPLEQVIAYGLEILPAFGYLHDRGLLYCDFKPDNAIHTADRIKLVDLGAVRRVDDEVSAVWGTVGYQAPEVATAGPSVASDLYTVARTMAVLSFDFRGFSTTYVDQLPDAATVPLLAREESYHRLLRRATHPDPARRFGLASEMAEQLLGVLRQLLAAADGAPRPAASTLFTGERRAFGTQAGRIDLGGIEVVGQPDAAPAFDGPAIVAALPVPRVDPTDPGAAILAAVRATDPGELFAAMTAANLDSAEVSFAVVRARIAGGDLDAAHDDLDGLAETDGLDWRVNWYRGLAELAAGDPAAARTAFDAVYDALPGELAPQLALAVAAEWDGDADAAIGYYGRVWGTDRGYVSAAFGLGRILRARGDRPAAVRFLDAVPDSSSHHVTAQIAAVLARLGVPPAKLVEADLVDASARLARLGLDVERHARLSVATLGAALDWVQGPGGRERTRAGSLDHQLTERELRLALERAYRVLAKVARDGHARIALVDRANAVRPRTLV